MTGPERAVCKAIAALLLEDNTKYVNSLVTSAAGTVTVAAVAELSAYPDLEDRRIVKALIAKGYATGHSTGWYRGVAPHNVVTLTAKGWLEALNR
jgi:hypothetical protein